MKPGEPHGVDQHELFRMELLNIFDDRHEPVRLAKVMDWSVSVLATHLF